MQKKTPLLHKHFHAGRHFISLPLAAICLIVTKFKGILAEMFILYCNMNNIRP
jgi:hypothetical protein